MSSFLNRIANWKTLVGLIFLDVLFPAVFFRHAGEKINEYAGKITGPVDLTFGFNPGRTLQMIAEYGDEGRRYYKMVELTTDIAYPVVYALLFAVAITLIYRKLLRGPVHYLISLAWPKAEPAATQNANAMPKRCMVVSLVVSAVFDEFDAEDNRSQSTKPFPTSHFWMTSAMSALFLSCISMWELPLMPMSGRLIQSTVPPAALTALAYAVSIFL